MMLPTKYQCSRPFGFREDDFVIFSLYCISLCKHVTQNFNKHRNFKGYQNIKALDLVVRDKEIFKVLIQKFYSKLI